MRCSCRRCFQCCGIEKRLLQISKQFTAFSQNKNEMECRSDTLQGSTGTLIEMSSVTSGVSRAEGNHTSCSTLNEHHVLLAYFAQAINFLYIYRHCSRHKFHIPFPITFSPIRANQLNQMSEHHQKYKYCGRTHNERGFRLHHMATWHMITWARSVLFIQNQFLFVSHYSNFTIQQSQSCMKWINEREKNENV